MIYERKTFFDGTRLVIVDVPDYEALSPEDRATSPAPIYFANATFQFQLANGMVIPRTRRIDLPVINIVEAFAALPALIETAKAEEAKSVEDELNRAQLMIPPGAMNNLARQAAAAVGGKPRKLIT